MDLDVVELGWIKKAVDEAVIIGITDKNGDIIYVNKLFCEVSQYSAEELIGKNHRILKSGYHPLEFYQELWKTITAGKTWRGEIKNMAKDGSHYWVKTVIVPILGVDGKPEHFVAIRTVITELKELQKILELQK